MQAIFRKFEEGNARSLFGDAGAWEHFLQGVPSDEGNLRAFEQELAFRRQFEEGELPFHVAQGCVWMDYHSIPQAASEETFHAAVSSILYYVERCDYFWVCAPPTTHKETKERKDYSTWRQRGWCRLEQTTNLLSRTLKMPLVVTNMSKIATQSFLENLEMLWGKPENSVACGSFTCCTLGHMLLQPDGAAKRIPCDKKTLGPVLLQLYE
eukprot:2837409-Amphidinium_carterae.1